MLHRDLILAPFPPAGIASPKVVFSPFALFGFQAGEPDVAVLKPILGGRLAGCPSMNPAAGVSP
jgi:hypothetical protein